LIPRKTSASRASENLCCRPLAPGSVKLVCLFACAYLVAAAAGAQDAQALLHKYRCDLCHAAVTAKTGPAYAEVAQRYRGDPKAEAKLAAFVRKGAHGGGPWPMPPHPEVSAAEAKKMARYILSVRD
jgi:cytochrome c